MHPTRIIVNYGERREAILYNASVKVNIFKRLNYVENSDFCVPLQCDIVGLKALKTSKSQFTNIVYVYRKIKFIISYIYQRNMLSEIYKINDINNR